MRIGVPTNIEHVLSRKLRWIAVGTVNGRHHAIPLTNFSAPEYEILHRKMRSRISRCRLKAKYFFDGQRCKFQVVP